MPETADLYHAQSNTAFQRFNFFVWTLTALSVSFFVGLIFLAPILKANGLAEAAGWIYAPFSYFCHQLSERSFHLHNEKLAVCARCLGVYLGLALGVFIYPVFRSLNDLQPLPRIYLLLSPVPTAIDFLLGYFDIWENTHLSRFLTASILGIGIAFFLIPGVIEISRYLVSRRR